jgi:membrane protein
MQGTEIVKDPRALFEMLKESYREWSEDKASRLAAALAYYTAFSVAPLLLIAISIAGLVFGRTAAEGQVYGQLQGLLGPDAAATIQTAIAQSESTGASTISALIGLAMLVWSASNVFSQLQDALNTIWEVQPDPNAGMTATVKRRVLSMTMVLGIGFLLLVSLVLSAGLSVVGNLVQELLPGGPFLWQIVNFGVSFGVVTLLFAAIYKVLPDVEIAWSDVWIGAAVTALLFTIGKLLIGLYLGYATVGSTFGAAGSLLVFLVWVYYSAQILFFGAELTQVYARRYGSRITPSEGAVPLTEEARAKQGISRRESVEQVARQPSGGAPVAGAVQANGVAPAGSRNGQPHAVASRNGNGSKKRARGSGGTKGAPDAVKKAMWAGLVAGSMAAGSVAARRAGAGIWRGVFHEDPPAKNG